MFGPVEVRVADTRIAGVDVVATLGTDYLGRLDTAAATATIAARQLDGADRHVEQGDGGCRSTPNRCSVAVTASRRADEKQGRNIVVLDVRSVLGITDYFVVVDAPNRRLVRTLVDDVEAGRPRGHRAVAVAGRG